MKNFLKKIFRSAILSLFFILFVVEILWRKFRYFVGLEKQKGTETPFIMIGLVDVMKDFKRVWR